MGDGVSAGSSISLLSAAGAVVTVSGSVAGTAEGEGSGSGVLGAVIAADASALDAAPPSIQTMFASGGCLAASLLQRASAIKSAMCARAIIATFRQKRAFGAIATAGEAWSRFPLS